MKIISNEVKKLFNPILLITLVVFIYIYCRGFLQLQYWPQVNTGNPWDTEVHAEMIKIFGPTLSRDEMPEFMEFYNGLVTDFEAEMQKSEIFKNNGIENYKQYCEAKGELRMKDELTDEDSAVDAEINRYTFELMPASELSFKLNELENRLLIDIENGGTFATDETIKNRQRYLDDLNPEMAEMIEKKFRSDETSLLTITPQKVVEDDSLHIVIICSLAVFSAVLFMLITDRLRGIYPIALSSKIGRKIFRIQAAVSGFFGLFAGIASCAIYGAALMNKGAGVFLDCPMDNYYYDMWIKLSYRQYLLIMAAAVIVFSGAAGLLSYIVGRFATNYISGLAVSIPVIVALCGAEFLAAAGLFTAQRVWIHSHYWSSAALPFVITLPICIGTVTAVCLILKHDGRRDIL